MNDESSMIKGFGCAWIATLVAGLVTTVATLALIAWAVVRITR